MFFHIIHTLVYLRRYDQLNLPRSLIPIWSGEDHGAHKSVSAYLGLFKMCFLPGVAWLDGFLQEDGVSKLKGGRFTLWASYFMKSSARTSNILCSSASRSHLLFSIAIWILLAGLSSVIQVHLWMVLWVVLQQGSAPVSVLLCCHFVKWVLNWVWLQCRLE